MEHNPKPEQRWRQGKRGSTYIEVGRAVVRTDIALLDHDEVVIYRSEKTGHLWALSASYFEHAPDDEVGEADRPTPADASGGGARDWEPRPDNTVGFAFITADGFPVVATVRDTARGAAVAALEVIFDEYVAPWFTDDHVEGLIRARADAGQIGVVGIERLIVVDDHEGGRGDATST